MGNPFIISWAHLLSVNTQLFMMLVLQKLIHRPHWKRSVCLAAVCQLVSFRASFLNYYLVHNSSLIWDGCFNFNLYKIAFIDKLFIMLYIPDIIVGFMMCLLTVSYALYCIMIIRTIISSLFSLSYVFA